MDKSEEKSWRGQKFRASQPVSESHFDHRVTPAQAGVHPSDELTPSRELRASGLDPGLRRDDTVGGSARVPG